MRKGLFLLAMLPWMVSAQFDLDTRYFTINSESLPVIEDFSESSFSLDNAPVLSKKIKTLRMTTENYRQPVEMATAIMDNQKFIQRKVDVVTLQQKFFGNSNSKIPYNSVGTSGVKNIAYKEVRGLDLLDPCPPIGICPRCAPYRIGRGY